jgi:hypothetical protein
METLSGQETEMKQKAKHNGKHRGREKDERRRWERQRGEKNIRDSRESEGDSKGETRRN